MFRAQLQAGPQVTGTDSQDQHADHPADHRVGEPGLDPGSGVAQAGATDPCWCSDKIVNVTTPGPGSGTSIPAPPGPPLRAGAPRRSGPGPGWTRRRCRRSPQHTPPRPPGPPGAGAGVAARAEAARAAQANASARRARAGPAPRRRPGRRPGRRAAVHPDHRPGDTPGSVPAMSSRARPPAGLALPPVPVQRTRRRHHVVQQVRRRDRRARRPQHADLKRQQQHRPGDPRRGRQHRDEVRRHQGDYLSPPGAKAPAHSSDDLPGERGNDRLIAPGNAGQQSGRSAPRLDRASHRLPRCRLDVLVDVEHVVRVVALA